jgi:hypothetical protein
MAAKKSTGGRNDNRPNGKAWKKNPGSDGVKVKHNVTRAGRIEGRSAANHAKREEWKARGGRVDHPSIPHWKTGLVYKSEKKEQVSADA